MTNLITRALLYAEKKHTGQTYGQYAYTKHLGDVARLVERYAPSTRGLATTDQMIAAAWLHDVLEDTDAVYEFLAASFGEVVAALVSSVTNEEGINRLDSKRLTYTKIYNFGEQAVCLKLCDRLANLCSCKETNNDQLLKMYQNESDLFLSRLGPPTDGVTELWGLVIDELLEEQNDSHS